MFTAQDTIGKMEDGSGSNLLMYIYRTCNTSAYPVNISYVKV